MMRGVSVAVMVSAASVLLSACQAVSPSTVSALPLPIIGLGTAADARDPVLAWRAERAEPPQGRVLAGELLVGISQPGVLPAALEGLSVRRLHGTRFLMVRTSPAAADDLGSRLLADPDVRWVTRHRAATPAAEPYYDGDPLTAYNPAMRLMKVQEALVSILDASREWRTSCVAVLDSGVQRQHPDLVGHVLAGFQTHAAFDPDTPPPSGDFDDFRGFHGTRVAGVISGAVANDTGAAGIAPGCIILPVMVADPSTGEMSTFAILSGMWLAAHLNRPEAPFGWMQGVGDGTPVHVVSMSLGFEGVESRIAAFDEMAGLLRQRGILVVASAGNAAGGVTAPANSPGVLAVGATVPPPDVEALAPYSNHGDGLDFVAPGSGIWTTDGANTATGLPDYAKAYARFTGTSASAPMVAAVAALIRGRYAEELAGHPAPADWIESRLRESAVDLGEPGWDPYFGWGRPDALRAVTGPFVP
ncbi:MAG: S8 family peptidase [Candidatus Sericytochromatia bacterium]|nr:S8 family peptidase [Candidatus Sericytochromatia bacterium]